MIPAIFLDRDGVIGENRVDHVKSWDEFCFLPGALDAMRWLRMSGLRTFVVTNQAIVNRGTVAPGVVEDIHMRMSHCIIRHGGWIDDLCYCPHDNHEHCGCRKPAPGMLVQLAEKWHIDLSRSYMVGDAWTDITAGQSVRCRSILVRTGRGNEQLASSEAAHHRPDHIAPDLAAAVTWVLAQEGIDLPLMNATTVFQRPVSMPWVAPLAVGG